MSKKGLILIGILLIGIFEGNPSEVWAQGSQCVDAVLTRDLGVIDTALNLWGPSKAGEYVRVEIPAVTNRETGRIYYYGCGSSVAQYPVDVIRIIGSIQPEATRPRPTSAPVWSQPTQVPVQPTPVRAVPQPVQPRPVGPPENRCWSGVKGMWVELDHIEDRTGNRCGPNGWETPVPTLTLLPSYTLMPTFTPLSPTTVKSGATPSVVDTKVATTMTRDRVEPPTETRQSTQVYPPTPPKEASVSKEEDGGKTPQVSFLEVLCGVLFWVVLGIVIAAWQTVRALRSTSQSRPREKKGEPPRRSTLKPQGRRGGAEVPAQRPAGEFVRPSAPPRGPSDEPTGPIEATIGQDGRVIVAPKTQGPRRGEPGETARSRRIVRPPKPIGRQEK